MNNELFAGTVNLITQMLIFMFFFTEVLNVKKNINRFLPTFLCIIVCVLIKIPCYFLIADNSTAFTDLTIFSIVIFMFSDKLWKKITLMAVVTALSIANLLIINAIVYGLYGYTYSEYIEIGKILSFTRLIAQDLLFFTLMILIIILKRGEFINKKTILSVLLLIAYPILHLLFITYFYKYYQVDAMMNSIQWSVMFVLLLIMILFYANAEMISGFYKNQITQERIESEKKSIITYYNTAKEKFDDISKIRHDIKNNLSVVSVLIDENKPDEAKEIIQKVNDGLEKQKAVMYCNNPTINAVLTVIVNKPENSKLHFEIILRDCDENMNIDNYDLCGLFSNLLDNACEAARKCENGKVSLKSIRHNDFFIIKVQNNYDSNKSDIKDLKSTKKEPGHGYGTQIISNIADKYKAKLSYETDEATNILTASVVFNL